MINVNSLTRSYEDFTAVADISFAIGTGEIVGLLGHNGAGKTTIMKMLTGYLEPTSGTIEIAGCNIATHRQEVQRHIGYLPENCPLYPEMTVAAYLLYIAALRQLPPGDVVGQVQRAIERTGLLDKATQPIHTLSRGYRQRVGVAQAILHEPSILILDEPTNGLDPSQILQMRALIKELAVQATILISTHILQEVQALCDRVLIINSGRKVLDASLQELQLQRRLLVTVGGAGSEAQRFFADFAGVWRVRAMAQAWSGGPGDTYELEVATDRPQHELAAELARAIHRRSWSLYGLTLASRSLETVFAETGGEGEEVR